MSVGNEIGLRISQLRGARSQQEVADALKVRRETITQWENGTRRIKDTDIIKLADYFGCSCDSILRGVDSKNLGIHREIGLTDRTIAMLRIINSSRYGATKIAAKQLNNYFNLLEAILYKAKKEFNIVCAQIEGCAIAEINDMNYMKDVDPIKRGASFRADQEVVIRRGQVLLEPANAIKFHTQELADKVKEIVVAEYKRVLEEKISSLEGGTTNAPRSKDQ